MKTYVLHQSQLNDYLRCPELFRRKYLGLVEDGPTDSTAIGTSLHAYADARITGVDQPEAEEIAFHTWLDEREHPLFRYVKVKTENTVLAHLARTTQLFETHVLPQLGDPTYVEQSFDLPLMQGHLHGSEILVRLAGTIDFGDWSLKDWKTYSDPRKYQAGYGGEGWKLKRFGIQPTVYCYAAHQLGHLDDPLTFDFVAIPKTQGEVMWLKVERGPADFAWLKKLCWNVVGMLESDLEEWPLNDQSALCSPLYCPVWASGECKGACT